MEMQICTERKYIDGTLYIIESQASENATETATDKVRHLILNDADTLARKVS